MHFPSFSVAGAVLSTDGVEKSQNALVPFLKDVSQNCACHAKRHLNVQKWSKPLVFLTF